MFIEITNNGTKRYLNLDHVREFGPCPSGGTFLDFFGGDAEYTDEPFESFYSRVFNRAYKVAGEGSSDGKR